MNTGKKGIRLIAEVCRRKGIRRIVFSPGSRSAPLVIAFSAISEMECLVIPDERVAGYFALGIAQQSGEPVAVICTSGTAVLNLSPAICEAFYQNIPLLILTADRPEGAASKGENQAIMQENIFSNHTLSNYSIDADVVSKRELEEIVAAISKATHDVTHGLKGPVHVNVHISEPLYEMSNDKLPVDIGYKEPEATGKEFIPLKDLQRIRNEFSYYRTKMIIVGMRDHDEEFYEILAQLSERKDLIIVNENLSNLSLPNTVWNTDATLSLISPNEKYIPDVVITMGKQILSKKIKQFLDGRPKIHWDIPPGSSWGRGWALFGDMFDPIEPVNEIQFLNAIMDIEEPEDSDFKNNWLHASAKATELSKQYFGKAEFSDLKVFEIITQSFPLHSNIQYGNSTPVRYGSFFQHHPSLALNANRGTSGIDGCVSTAAGAAYENNRMTICIVGDVSFFYDSNALWNNYLSPNLRIIVINNSGGNIFRLLDGPQQVNGFEKFFETRHHLTAEHLATMYGLPYYICASQNEVENTLKTFYEPSERPKLLEIKTDGAISAGVYKKYFEYLTSNK